MCIPPPSLPRQAQSPAELCHVPLCSVLPQELQKLKTEPTWLQLVQRMMPKLKEFLTEELVKIHVPTTPCAA